MLDEIVNVLLDSGSHASLINLDLAQKLSQNYDLKIHSSRSQLRSITGNELSVVGQITIPFQFSNFTEQFNFTVVDNNFGYQMLCGRNFMKKFDVGLYFGGKTPTVTIRHVPQKCINKNADTLGVNYVTTEPKSVYVARARFDTGKIPGGHYGQLSLKVPKFLENKVVYFEATNTDTTEIVIPRTIAKVTEGHITVPAINVLDKMFTSKNNKIAGGILLTESYNAAKNSSVSVENKDIFYSALRKENTENRSTGDQNNYTARDCIKMIEDSSERGRNLKFKEMLQETDVSHLTNKEAARIKELLRANKEAISIDGEIGHVRGHSYKVILPKDETPVYVPQYRVPFKAKEIIEEQVSELLSQGVIEPSTSPFNSPLLLVKKPKGDGYRFCVDYRKLNERIVKDTFPIPRADTVIDQLSGSTVFSCIDMKHGYFQIPLDEESRKYTTFRTESGSFQFTRTPQGLATSTAAFQRICNMVFSEQLGKFMFAYIDDLIVFSKSFSEHLDHLAEVFDVIIKSGFKNWTGKMSIC